MRAKQFLEETFPLVVKWDGGQAPLVWFHDVGIARIAGEFVVEVVPHFAPLEADMPSQHDGRFLVKQAYAYGWTGLDLRIVEHGVGEITKWRFSFEEYCVSRAEVNQHFERFHRVHPKGLAIVEEVLQQRAKELIVPAPFWRVVAPTKIKEELLEPMQAYIAKWL